MDMIANVISLDEPSLLTRDYMLSIKEYLIFHHETSASVAEVE